MTYIKPDDVISPQNSWILNCVIYDEGEGGVSISYGEWDKKSVMAMRWNGICEPHKGLGNPQSSGHATWFILPHETGVSVINDILIKQTAGNKNIRQECLTLVIDWLKKVDKISSSIHEIEKS